MKYKVKNTVTGEETICEKVVVDNQDYYVNDSVILFDEYYLYSNQLSKRVRKNPLAEYPYPQYKKVIATTNKSLGLPMVIDEVEIITEELCTKKGLVNNTIDLNAYAGGLIDGYNKAKENYSYTKEDLINFKQQAPLILEQLNGASDSDLFDIWQEQRTIEILVK